MRLVIHGVLKIEQEDIDSFSVYDADDKVIASVSLETDFLLELLDDGEEDS